MKRCEHSATRPRSCTSQQLQCLFCNMEVCDAILRNACLVHQASVSAVVDFFDIGGKVLQERIPDVEIELGKDVFPGKITISERLFTLHSEASYSSVISGLRNFQLDIK
ncbi:hypothetical protein TNCV_1298081 [Trichonephila clavipes]|nr:hypothetical protein TNCV_1298081 [Trichonephila clavipes]